MKMRGALTLRRIGWSVVGAAALSVVCASPAAAMIAPACSTRVVLGTPGSCTFDTQYDYATITIVPVASTVTADFRCVTNYGYVFTSSRTVSDPVSYSKWTPGSCTLTLSSPSGGTGAVTATPTTGPIIDPPPPPY